MVSDEYVTPNVLCYIKLLQSNEQRLTAIPVMIFGIGVERNDDVSEWPM